MVESTKFSCWDNDINPPMVTALPINVATPVEQQPHYEASNSSTSSTPVVNDPLISTDANNNNNNATPEGENPNEGVNDNLKYGAGIAGGIFGLLLGGPIFAAIAGFGAAYGTQQEGMAGDACRAVGEVAIAAKEKAQEVNEKHNIVDESNKAANHAWESAKEMDRQHGIVDKLKQFATVSLKFAIGGIRFITKKIVDSVEDSCSDDNDTNNNSRQ
jgi:hypothetical protein